MKLKCLPLTALVTFAFLYGCSSTSESQVDTHADAGVGGSTSAAVYTGGASSDTQVGGGTSEGGASTANVGGGSVTTSKTGTTPTTGGVASGGISSTATLLVGGSVATGGSVASGGAAVTTSVPTMGGMPSGGVAATGGTPSGGVTATGGTGSTIATGSSVTAGGNTSHQATVTVTPTIIDDLLVNPGIGFADFSVEGSLAPETEYPRGTVAYARWTWAELEPTEGQYDFARVDNAIAKARARGETLAFRIMPCWEGSTPKWLLDKGVDSVAASDGTFPDHNSPIFLDYHERLVRAFGARYARSLDIDHVDIGSVGCWGEWNTACCDGTSCDELYPTEANQLAIIDWYIEAFAGTPLVALIGGPSHAEEQGAGWRGDCFGDYGFFDADWNHMDDTYQPASKDPVIGNAWKTAPVQFEACGVMQDWYDAGYDIDLILAKGLEWHMSVFNGKSSPVPVTWRAKVDEWQKRLGYRFVLASLTHSSQVTPGGSLALHATWENRGVAPAYHPWPVAFRLRDTGDRVVAKWTSAADVRKFLPGNHVIDEVLALPTDVTAATYSLDVAVLTEDAAAAHVRLAIAGARTDLWYPISTVTVE